MTSPRSPGLVRRAVDRGLYRALVTVATTLRALPSRWVLALARHGAWLLYLGDTRGRRVGRQNLRVVFGDTLDERAARDLLLRAFEQSLRSALLLLHASPLTPARTRRWVRVAPEAAARLEMASRTSPGGVLVSGHLGNWELLLGAKSLFPHLQDVCFLAESLAYPWLDRFLQEVRGSGGARSAFRLGGASTLRAHVKKGGAAALLVDRNVRGEQGGIWAPFLGLPARTTPLPAWLAVRHRVHLLPLFCLPTEDEATYELWVGPNLADGLYDEEPDVAIPAITRRINEVLERLIRARPDLWNWTLKRFKSRPERELGAYPPYSLWDPDEAKRRRRG